MSSRTERACMLCGLIQPYRQFANQGCPNCNDKLDFQSDDYLVQECTSPTFEGQVALCDGDNSWVARWLRIDHCQPGIYAVKVNGRIPDEIVQQLRGKGVHYRPRDGSVQD